MKKELNKDGDAAAFINLKGLHCDFGISRKGKQMPQI